MTKWGRRERLQTALERGKCACPYARSHPAITKMRGADLLCDTEGATDRARGLALHGQVKRAATTANSSSAPVEEGCLHAMLCTASNNLGSATYAHQGAKRAGKGRDSIHEGAPLSVHRLSHLLLGLVECPVGGQATCILARVRVPKHNLDT